MTTRRHYLICYDISRDDSRTDVFHHLQANGDHVQYSVFTCQLNPAELIALKAHLTPLIDHRTDQLLIVDLGPAHHPLQHRLQYLGRPYHPPTRVTVI